MTELRNCPVCDSANVGVRNWWNSLHETGYFAECMDCGCMVGFMADPMGWCAAAYDTEEEAAKAWNTRTDDYRAAADYWQRMYEQTVLERRTCTNGVKPGVGVMPRLYCSNCGCYTTLNKPDNATSYSESFMDWPFYCGNCGARVEGDDR